MLSPLRAQAPPAVERAALIAGVGLLSAGAWLSMGFSGAGGVFHLHHLSPAAVGRASFLLFFVASWTVMTVAMMLPTSLPILATLHSFAGGRRDRALLVALAIGGYLLTWTLFGVLVYLVYLLWQRWLGSNFPGGAPLLLLLAGAFQFSSLKYKCLDRCRSPFSFVVEHWQGSRERWQAFLLGVDHGLFCVGCCWALMLLMFAVGTGSLAGMLVLAVVMAVEKNVSWGRRLSAPLGVALLAWGAALLAFP
jgi:predicted metal-binding membrane protein